MRKYAVIPEAQSKTYRLTGCELWDPVCMASTVTNQLVDTEKQQELETLRIGSPYPRHGHLPVHSPIV